MFVKYIVSLNQLKELNELAIQKGYNRALDESFFEQELSGPDFFLCPVMEHEHIGGELTEDKHYRCVIEKNEKVVGTIDIPIGLLPDP